MGLAVRARKASVGVRIVVGLAVEMVEGGVPVPLLVVRALARRAGENLVPLCAGGCADALEVPSWDVGGEVALRAVRAGHGEGDFHQQGLIRRDIECRYIARGLVRRPERPRHALDRPPRTVERDRVGDLAAADPARAEMLAAEGARVRADLGLRAVRADIDLARVRLVDVVADSEGQVDEDLDLAGLRPREAVDRRALRRRDLDAEGVVRLHDRVEAGFRALGRLVDRPPHRHQAEIARERQDLDVAVVGAARPREVRLRVAEDGLVAVLVAGAVGPVVAARVRPGLHHAERHTRARVGVARARRARERVDIGREVLRRPCRESRARGGSAQPHDFGFHLISRCFFSPLPSHRDVRVV